MSHKEAQQTEQEAKLLARFNHPNIVGFYESFQEASQGKLMLCIVMEYADGGDLSNLIKGRKGRSMPENQVLNITVQIALALKHVHDRKILHRDLKSQNIFLTSKGIVKLGDFGIAKVLRNTGELASTQIGTPYFMSPEILAGKRYNNKTDIWSLGCVIFELITLRVPFQGNSMKQLVSNIINMPVPGLPSLYSQELRSLVTLMLAKNYKDRPSINSILGSSIFREKIEVMLNDQVRKREFSHTVLHGDDILQVPFPHPKVTDSALPSSKNIPVIDRLPPKPKSDNNYNRLPVQQPIERRRIKADSPPNVRPRVKVIQPKVISRNRESELVKKSPNDDQKSRINNGKIDRSRKVSRPPVPQQNPGQRNSPKSMDLKVEGQLISRTPIVGNRVEKLLPEKNDAQERRLRYLQLKDKKMGEKLENNSPSAQSPNANWLNDLQHQMDALKLKINDLQSPAIKPEIRSPHCHPISHNQLSKEEPHNRSNKNTEDPLGLRRRKREQDSKNFRNFLRAQRQQVSPTTPSLEESKKSLEVPSQQVLEPLASYSDKVLAQTRHDLNADFLMESPEPTRDPGEALRLRRDKEREDLRRMIAQKRKENKKSHEILTDQPSSVDIATPRTNEAKLLNSSFFKYSQDDINVHRRSTSFNSDATLIKEFPEDCNMELVSPNVCNSLSTNANDIAKDSDQEVESDSDDNVEYDNLILAMKGIMEKAELIDELEEFEEEEVHIFYLNEESPIDMDLATIDEEVTILESHPSAEKVLAAVDEFFTEHRQAPNHDHHASHDDKNASTGSWDDFSDEEPLNQNAFTVYGVPFPLSKTTCKLPVDTLDESTPASRMEALREYLENALGIDSFIKVYRLLKSVGPKDDDDELLGTIEGIIGVDGLCYMDAFFQLIHIEDKFES